MSEPTIACPHCKHEIKLTESLAAPLIETTRQQYEQRLAAQAEAIQQREATIQREKAALQKAREEVDAQVATKVEEQREAIAAAEHQKAVQKVATDLQAKDRELAELQGVLIDRESKLAEAAEAKAELIRKSRELDDAKREMNLTIETKVQESLGAVREKAKKEAEEGAALKVRERDEVIAGMQRQIEDLKRKAEQGSQQLQGEVQELVLEETLRARFPRDQIEPVPKGQFGGDILHRVFGPDGQVCGTILWEAKRTRNWSDGWLPKLRNDMRAAKADIALIVSQALPKEVETFDLVDGVWVADPRFLVPVATALRESLISLSGARRANEGQQTKTEMIYQYLTGPRFKHHVEAIVERFTDMQNDLNRERRSMTAMWKKREEQINAVIEATAGMYGDLQGIAGRSLQEIEGLHMPLIEGPEVDAAE